jgi:hypothetical protein
MFQQLNQARELENLSRPAQQARDQARARHAQLAFEQAVAQLGAELNALVQKNAAEFEALAKRGIRFDPGQLLSARIDMLMSSVAQAFGPQGQLWELQARLANERNIEQHLERAGSQGRLAQLAAGGSFSPAMLRELATQTGTYGGLGS